MHVIGDASKDMTCVPPSMPHGAKHRRAGCNLFLCCASSSRHCWRQRRTRQCQAMLTGLCARRTRQPDASLRACQPWWRCSPQCGRCSLRCCDSRLGASISSQDCFLRNAAALAGHTLGEAGNGVFSMRAVLAFNVKCMPAGPSGPVLWCREALQSKTALDLSQPLCCALQELESQEGRAAADAASLAAHSQRRCTRR